MKSASLVLVVAAVAAVVFTGSALSAAKPASTLTISHIVKGCHTWALGGAKPAVNQTVKLRHGQSLTILNTDLMPHQLIRSAGAKSFVMKLVKTGVGNTGTLKAPYAAGMMPHMSSELQVTFPTKGVYVFKTKSGEDYTNNVKTVGEDNVLRVKVIVG